MDETAPERVVIRVDDAPQQPDFISHAVRHGDLVFTSGAPPRHPLTREIPEGFEAQAQQCLDNLEAMLRGARTSLRRALKVTVYLADIADWAAMNDVYRAHVEPGAAPARTTVEVAAMNSGYLIEIEAIAVAGP